MTPRALDAVYGAVLLAAAGLLYLSSYADEVPGQPVSGNAVWYPRILLVLMATLSILLIGRGLLAGAQAALPGVRWRPLAAATALTGVYLASLQDVGFLPATLLLLPLMSWMLGFRRPAAIAVVTIGFTVAVWYGFNDLFNMTPPGPGLPSLVHGG